MKNLIFLAGLFVVSEVSPQTLTVSPDTGTDSVTPTITWSGFSGTCTASGAWTGTKAASGEETLPAIDSDATYTLTCSAGQGSVTLNWVAPTKNTNGTALTNLAKYRVYRAVSATAQPIGVDVGLPATSYVWSNVSVGTHSFWVTAVNSVGVESDKSAMVMQTVQGSTVTKSVTVTVAPRPSPPSGLTVVESTAYNIRLDWWRLRIVLGSQVGSVPLGTTCKGDFRIGDYYRVDRSQVSFFRPINDQIIVVKCRDTLTG